MSRKAATCDICGTPLVPIVYGMVGPEQGAAAARGEIILGGCVIEPAQPTMGCPQCQ